MHPWMEPPIRSGGSHIPPQTQSARWLRPSVQPSRIQSWLSRPIGKISLTVLVMIVVGIGGFFLVHSLQLHGLPGDIPLPNNASFFRSDQTTVHNPPFRTYTQQKWGWTISGTSLDQIESFYHSQLPLHGWQRLVGGTDTVLSAEKGDMQVFIGAQLLPYHGDIILIIELHTPTS